MKKHLTNQGFIQLPILIGIIFVIIFTTSAASYFGVKYFKLSNQPEIEKVKENTSQKEVENFKDKAVNKPPEISPSIEISVPVQDSNIKIEQCKVTKESAYNDATLKINQATNERLQEVFNSLDQQYKEAVSKIYSYTDSQISRIMNEPSLTSASKLSLISDYNDDASEQAETLYNNQQTFWKNQKQEIENSKQKAIDQINLLLSEEYSKCLSKE